MPESGKALGLRNALVEQHRRLAVVMAASFHRRFPNSRFELDDLVSIGVLALFSAAARYDPGRGASFATYARHRIRGALLDALGGAVPPSCASTEDLPDPEPADLDALITLRERRQALRRAIESLPPRQASVIELRYEQGLTQAAAGQRLGISQPGARDLEQRAIRRLQRSLHAAA